MAALAALEKESGLRVAHEPPLGGQLLQLVYAHVESQLAAAEGSDAGAERRRLEEELLSGSAAAGPVDCPSRLLRSISGLHLSNIIAITCWPCRQQVCLRRGWAGRQAECWRLERGGLGLAAWLPHPPPLPAHAGRDRQQRWQRACAGLRWLSGMQHRRCQQRRTGPGAARRQPQPGSSRLHGWGASGAGWRNGRSAGMRPPPPEVRGGLQVGARWPPPRDRRLGRVVCGGCA